MPMGNSKEVKKELEQDTLKGTECISHVRQNAQVSELYHNLSLPWLLNWFPRPTVKLKFVAQREDELYGGFDDRSKVFVGNGECSIFDARGHSGIPMVNEYTSDQRSDTQHDEVIGGKMGKQFGIEVESAAMWQPRTIVHFELKFGVDARAVERLDHGTMNGIEYVQHIVAFSCYRTCSQANEFKETERLPIARRNASLRELAVTLNAVTNLTRLSIRFPKPMVKMKLMNFASRVGYEEETLNSNVSFSERNGTDLARLYAATKKVGKEIARTYNRIHGLSITELRFFTCYGLWERPGMTYFFFTKDVLQGKSIPILEADSHETVAVGKNTGSSSVMKKAYQLSDIDWLVSIWFPQPTVKMKHERLGSEIPKPSVKLKYGEGKA